MNTITLKHNNTPYGYISIIGEGAHPAIGGVRICAGKLPHTAEKHCASLAKTMLKKAKLADLPLNGAKGIIYIEHPEDRPILLENFAQTLNELKGKYITAVDVGSTEADMNFIRQLTSFVTCQTETGGDPSAYTATTVIQGVRAGCNLTFKDSSLDCKHIVIQGLGKVGLELLKQLKQSSAHIKITVCDIDTEKTEKYARTFQVKFVDPERCYETSCDIFIAAANSFLIGKEEAQQLNCRIFASAANNAFNGALPEKILEDRGIVLLHDYLINSGGLIHCAYQYGIIPDLNACMSRIYHSILGALSQTQYG